MDFEFDPKDHVYVRIDRRRKLPSTVLLRALGMTNQEILETFFERDKFTIHSDQVRFGLVPERPFWN